MDKILKPNRSLGQIFLIDRNIQKKIVMSCDFCPQNYVLEIGAGRGELSILLLERGVNLVALEVDNLLFENLKKKLKNFKNIKLIKKNILDFNIKRYFDKLTNEKIKVIGNIPYYITTPIIQHLFKHYDKIDEVFLTVQKEFAYRAVSKKGSKLYGALSCYIQYYTEPQILFEIKRNSFWPIPKVDSCFLKLKFKKNYPLSKDEEKLLFKIIHSAFNKRRKILKNSLKDIISPSKLEEFSKRFNISTCIRPEDLDLVDFINMAKYLNSHF